jgi:hypothetical protein
MATISKKSAKKLHAHERRNAMHPSSSHKGPTPTPPAQLSEFPDINVRQETANYFRAYQQRPAPTLVVEPVTNKSPVPAPAPIPSQPSDETVTTAANWSDPRTVTLQQIDENTRRLLREWPKDDGIPFPMEILEVLRDLKLKVLARDAERRHSATGSVGVKTDTAGAICTPAPAHLANDSTEPNTPVPDLGDSVSTTTNNLAHPNTATADLWRKVARKAAKMGYQHEYYGAVLRTPVLTKSRVQPVTAITPAISNSTAPVTTPASILTPTSAPVLTPIQINFIHSVLLCLQCALQCLNYTWCCPYSSSSPVVVPTDRGWCCSQLPFQIMYLSQADVFLGLILQHKKNNNDLLTAFTAKKKIRMDTE